jgi:hypothetical protein
MARVLEANFDSLSLNIILKIMMLIRGLGAEKIKPKK